MKIILVATNSRGKNLVFVSDALRAYSLEEAVELARKEELENVYTVKGKNGTYLRTKPNTPRNEQLERISISSYRLFASSDDIRHAMSTPAFSKYWLAYQHSLEYKGGPYIVIDGRPRITKETAREKLEPHRDLIFKAARRFDVDPYLLGAIIIDEIARFGLLESITDPLAGYFVGVNTSAGIAQVEIETARDLIEKNLYNPNPSDTKLSPANIKKASRARLYRYVRKPKHSIFFAAARMRALIDEWESFVDISKKPEIITTLYSLEYRHPHSHPRPNDRGLQITDESYGLAKGWLR